MHMHTHIQHMCTGFRVPMMLISPWTRGGFVCSEVFDHTSVIKFIEKVCARQCFPLLSSPLLSSPLFSSLLLASSLLLSSLLFSSLLFSSPFLFSLLFSSPLFSSPLLSSLLLSSPLLSPRPKRLSMQQWMCKKIKNAAGVT